MRIAEFKKHKYDAVRPAFPDGPDKVIAATGQSRVLGRTDDACGVSCRDGFKRRHTVIDGPFKIPGPCAQIIPCHDTAGIFNGVVNIRMIADASG